MFLVKQLRHWLKLSQPDKQKVLERTFELIYNVAPGQDELDFSRQLTSSLPQDDWIGIFRAVIHGFDHQRFQTPFTVRFSETDIAYLTIDDYELAIDKKDISVSMPLYRREYEPHLFRFFSQQLKPGMTFIDIGANIGFYSMLAAQKVGKTGQVFCFEPNSENCRLIMLSIDKNKFENVSIYPVALGNKTGHTLFSTHLGSNGGLVPNTTASLLSPNCVITPIIKLEDVIKEKVDLIKIDVEGAEGYVLEGAKKIIETYRPIVTSEFSLEMLPRVSKMAGKDYLGYFRDNQYKIYMCDRETQALIPITDINSFIDNYGEVVRIEDLVFMPQ